MSRLRSVTDLLAELVSIPSVNPHGEPGTAGVGEGALAKHLAEFLSGLGAEVQLKEILPGRPNVYAVFHPDKTVRQQLAFAPHTDTVSVAGMTVAPFKPEIRNGRLYGRGASDTKGPMAAALWALAQWSRSRERLQSQTRWTFAALMDEEAAQEGSQAWGASGFKADLVIVLEPTEMKVVHAHKGTTWISLRTAGRACHASMPQEGVNAVLKMRRVIDTLEKKVIPVLKRKKNRSLGSVTFNVGIIRGGSKINIVPDRCEIECDIRTIPEFEGRAVLELIRREVGRVVPDFRLEKVKIAPSIYVDPKLPWVRKLSEGMRGVTVAPWFCDSAFIAKAGRPAVALGPGSIEQAHTRDEFIRLSDLEDGYKRFLKFIQSN